MLKILYKKVRRISLKLINFIKIKVSILFSMIAKLFKKLLILFHRNLSIIFSWIIIIAITLIFQNKISDFLAENSFIKHKDVKTEYFKLAFIIFTIIFSIRYIWFIIKNYRLAKKNNYIIFFISIIYIFLRNDENDSLYFSYLDLRFNLFYSDIILFVGVFSAILLIRNVFIKNWKLYDRLIFLFNNILSSDKNHFDFFLIEDLPLDNKIKNDNEKVIDEVVKAVINLKPGSSFIIGVNSIWGLGKTSFLKRLEYKLQVEEISEECKPITFWFNAWQHQDEKSIINNFFNQLKKELSVFSGDSKNSIDNYLKEMLALVDNKYLNLFKSITGSLFEETDTMKGFYNDINNIIEEIDRKIIVFVDDIDRLNKAEILEILRILRNIADFRNVIFICAFDRDYVLKQSQIDNHYLDKIFNLEISLTTQNQKNLVIYLNDLIDKSLAYNDENKKSLIEAINKIFYNEEYLISFFDKLVGSNEESNEVEIEQFDLIPSFFFESRRDVKKFFNELYINIKTLENISDVELEGYIELKLLLFKYKWMHRNFTSKKIDFWLGKGDNLRFSGTDLKNIYTHPELEKQDEIIIYSILKKIFPNIDGISDARSINNRRYFPIYYSNNVFNESFSFTELYRAIENNKVETLIKENVIGNDNEIFIKDDIKKFILKSENIRTLVEFEQVVLLIKKELLGYISNTEILDLIHIGEIKFETEYEKLLPNIFDNLNDNFGILLQELSMFYSQFPKETLLNSENSIRSFANDKKIKDFKKLNETKLKEILFDLMQKEIKNKKDNFIEILYFSKFFYFEYYNPLYFGVLLEEFKELILKFINENFESIFLQDDLVDTIMKIDFIIIANIYEDADERKNLIEEAKFIIKYKSSSLGEFNDFKELYIKNGLNTFGKKTESLEKSISKSRKEKYINFLDFLNAYKSNDYKFLPSNEDIKEFKEKRKP